MRIYSLLLILVLSTCSVAQVTSNKLGKFDSLRANIDTIHINSYTRFHRPTWFDSTVRFLPSVLFRSSTDTLGTKAYARSLVGAGSSVSNSDSLGGVPASGYVTIANSQTITGAKSFIGSFTAFGSKNTSGAVDGVARFLNATNDFQTNVTTGIPLSNVTVTLPNTTGAILVNTDTTTFRTFSDLKYVDKASTQTITGQKTFTQSVNYYNGTNSSFLSGYPSLIGGDQIFYLPNPSQNDSTWTLLYGEDTTRFRTYSDSLYGRKANTNIWSETNYFTKTQNFNVSSGNAISAISTSGSPAIFGFGSHYGVHGYSLASHGVVGQAFLWNKYGVYSLDNAYVEDTLRIGKRLEVVNPIDTAYTMAKISGAISADSAYYVNKTGTQVISGKKYFTADTNHIQSNITIGKGNPLGGTLSLWQAYSDAFSTTLSRSSGTLTSNITLYFPIVASLSTIATINGGQTFTSATWNGTDITPQYLDTTGATGLRSIYVPYNGATGAVNLGAQTFTTTGNVTGDGIKTRNNTGASSFSIIGDTVGVKDISWYARRLSGDSARWTIRVNNAENGALGSNAGSDFTLLRRTDNGSLAGTVLSINRSTGNWTYETGKAHDFGSSTITTTGLGTFGTLALTGTSANTFNIGSAYSTSTLIELNIGGGTGEIGIALQRGTATVNGDWKIANSSGGAFTITEGYSTSIPSAWSGTPAMSISAITNAVNFASSVTTTGAGSFGALSGTTGTFSSDITLQGARNIKNNVNDQSLSIFADSLNGTKSGGFNLYGGRNVNEGQVDVLFGTRDSTLAQQDTEFRVRFNNSGIATQYLVLNQNGNMTLGANNGTGSGGIWVDTVAIGTTVAIDASRNATLGTISSGAITATGLMTLGTGGTAQAHQISSGSANALTLYRAINAASAAASGLNFAGQTADGTQVTYATIQGLIQSVSNSLQSGGLQFITRKSAVEVKAMMIDSLQNVFLQTQNTSTNSDTRFNIRSNVTGLYALAVLPSASATKVAYIDTSGSTLVSGLITAIVTKTADYTATKDDYTILCNNTANITITLPASASHTGRIYNIKKINSSGATVTVDANSTELIDGALTQIISAQWTNLQIQSNGTAWYIL